MNNKMWFLLIISFVFVTVYGTVCFNFESPVYVNSPKIVSSHAEFEVEELEGSSRIIPKLNQRIHFVIKLDSGYEWKSLLRKGFLPKQKVEDNARYTFYPGHSGWLKDPIRKNDSENTGYGIPLDCTSYKNHKSKWIDSDTLYQTLECKIYFLYKNKIHNAVLVNEKYRGFNKNKFYFKSKSLDELKIKSYLAFNVQKEFLLYIEDSGIMTLTKVDFNERMLGVPKEYFPIATVDNEGYIGCSGSHCYELKSSKFDIGNIVSNREYGMKDRSSRSKKMPLEIKIPKTQKLSIPFFSKGNKHSLVVDIIWRKNENFEEYDPNKKCEHPMDSILFWFRFVLIAFLSFLTWLFIKLIKKIKNRLRKK